MENGWFPGTPEFVDTPVRPVRRQVKCPADGCKGTLHFNGTTWPTGDPGYHHTCDACGVVLAITGGRYPQTVFLPIKD